MLAGMSSLLFNCPLDMLIERELRGRFPVLRSAQFVSLSILVEEAKQTVVSADIHRITPRKILNATNALNGAHALFLDRLFSGASEFAAPYRRLDTFSVSQRLVEHLESKVETINPGGEYALVDDFADIVGLRGWYEWVADRGSHEVKGTSQPEGTTNPELLREKHPAAVWYMLSALKLYDTMPLEQVRAIALEVAITGQRGLDYADPAQKYTLRSLPGAFSGLQLMCLMYAGFKRIAPDQDVGMDLHEPFITAVELFEVEKRKGLE